MENNITIVICTYNGSAYIKEAIESILFQDNLEKKVDKILIVDNNSTDNTKEIVLEIASENTIVKYVFEEIPGVTNARKHGALVDTEWVIFIDDDNIVSENWLESTDDFIKSHPEVGVFNSAIIGELRFNPSKEEELIYNSFYNYLACFFKNFNDYESGKESKIKGPVGAGMGLRVKPLKKFLNEGWTKNVGRKGNQLTSGEDGEIARAVLNAGYKYEINLDTYIKHIIPKERLQKPYMDKLISGLDQGHYVFISTKKYYLYYRFRMFVKSVLLIPILSIGLLFIRNEVKRTRTKSTIKIRFRLLKYLFSDFFVLRRK